MYVLREPDVVEPFEERVGEDHTGGGDAAEGGEVYSATGGDVVFGEFVEVAGGGAEVGYSGAGVSMGGDWGSMGGDGWKGERAYFCSSRILRKVVRSGWKGEPS